MRTPNTRVGVVVVVACVVAFVAIHWFADRRGFGLAMIGAFILICFVAVIRRVLSERSAERARRGIER